MAEMSVLKNFTQKFDLETEMSVGEEGEGAERPVKEPGGTLGQQMQPVAAERKLTNKQVVRQMYKPRHL